jgi:hypothetical protein
MKKKSYRTPHEVAVKGFEALVEKLGPGGALQFIHQYETGTGDYTSERKRILRGVTLRKLRAALLK